MKDVSSRENWVFVGWLHGYAKLKGSKRHPLPWIAIWSMETEILAKGNNM